MGAERQRAEPKTNKRKPHKTRSHETGPRHTHRPVFIVLQRDTEEKARQPETKLSAIAQTRHIARPRNAKRSRTKHPKPTHGVRDRPKQPQPRAGQDRASGSGQRTRRDVRARPTQGRVAPAKGNAKLPERPRDQGGPREARPASLHGLVGQVPEQRQGWGLKAPEGQCL
jgi:hypothetical protein